MTEYEFLAGFVVLLPLLAAVFPLVGSVRYSRIGWHVAAIVLTINLAIATYLAWLVYATGRIRYALAGIDIPYGVELHVDAFSATIILLDSLLALAVLGYTRTAGPRGNSFYSAYLLLTGGIIGIAVAGDLFNLYVFLEVMGIASYAIIVTGTSRWSTYAAMKYLLMGTVGATIYLLGVTFVFATTGTLNMIGASEQLAAVGHTEPVVTTAFVLLVVGLAVKIALVPVHTWLGDAHAAAPSAVSAMLSGLMPAAAVYALTRVLFTTFTVDFLRMNPWLWRSLVAVALLSLLVANFIAVLQRDVKLMLAYSTISQFGLVVAGLAIANETAVFGSILHIFGHGVIKGGLFLVAGMFTLRYGVRTVEEYAGLAKHAPLLGLAFAGLAIAMIGLPPTVGFVGKWYIALGAIRAGMWLVAALVVVSTLLTVMYTLPFINQLYFRDLPETIEPTPDVTRTMLAVVVLATVFSIVLGLVSAWLESALSETIQELLR